MKGPKMSYVMERITRYTVGPYIEFRVYELKLEHVECIYLMWPIPSSALRSFLLTTSPMSASESSSLTSVENL